LSVPANLSPAYRDAIELELSRLEQSASVADDAAVLGHVKCLAEAVSKVILDLNGTPDDGSASFETVVRRAHELLARQRGHELSHTSATGNIATQARKIVTSLGEMRNAYGAGHGRARVPEVSKEMLDLAVDGSLMWCRWALRRSSYFAMGRPSVLIRDLIGDADGPPLTFRSGDLAARLEAAGLADLEERHVRAVGVAVGQRTARGTFVVAADGVQSIFGDADAWPEAYRSGVIHGLLFDPYGHATITASSVLLAVQVLGTLSDPREELGGLTTALSLLPIPRPLPGDDLSRAEAQRLTIAARDLDPPASGHWRRFAELLFGAPLASS